MNRSRIDDDWEFTLPSNSFNTLVLFGTTGNGKSATGNSILGREAFKSESSFFGVTSTCELKSTLLRDGRTINVIDTPGLFDSSDDSGAVGKEILKCADLAKNGIHALLMILSVRSRFSSEEEAAIEKLKMFFGEKILDYMIVVFTGGDDLESAGKTLNDYLGRKKHPSLQRFLDSCKERIVLFDNKTKDERKRANQLQQLMNLVDSVLASNGGKPFSDDLLEELKRGAKKLYTKEKEVESMKGYSEEQISKLKDDIYKSYEDQLIRINNMVEEKLKMTVEKLERQLAEEQAARLAAEKISREASLKSEEEIRKLRESLESAQRYAEEIKKQAENKKCTIL